MKEWEAVEAAVQNEDWPAAAVLARGFADEWSHVTGMVRVFVPTSGDAWLDASNRAFAGLAETLQRPGVKTPEVEAAMRQARAFVVLEPLE